MTEQAIRIAIKKGMAQSSISRLGKANLIKGHSDFWIDSGQLDIAAFYPANVMVLIEIKSTWCLSTYV